MKNKNQAVMVEREPYTKNNKNYFAYFVRGNIRGVDVKISIMPPEKDYNGYVVLDIIFGDSNATELLVKPFEIKNEASGEVITGNTYGVKSVDEDGEIYEFNVKPAKRSDKALLNMLLKQVSKA